MTPLKQSEAKIQQDCVIWFRNEFCRLNAVRYDPRNLIAHVRNEHRFGNDSTVHKGFADLIVEIHGRPQAVYVEMKIPGKDLEPAQIKFKQWCELMDRKHFVCRSLEEFKQVIENL